MKNNSSFSFSKKIETTQTVLQQNAELKYKMIAFSLLIGALSGLVIVIYRILGEFLLHHTKSIYALAKNKPFFVPFIFIALVLAAFFVAFCVKKEPNISGSGIPQVEGTIMRKMQTKWYSVLFYKFIGGVVTFASGLSVGREGPSIQMGAAIGQGVSQKTNCLDFEHKFLLTSGASAGLAAAFNAPLAGVMFALEEVHKNFSPIVLMSAMMTSVTADVISKSILGIKPSLHFATLQKMPIKYYWSLVLLGVLVALSSYVFNRGVIKGKHLYRKLPLKLEHKILIPFLFAGVLGLTFPLVIGGGHTLIMSMGTVKFSLLSLLVIFVLKYLFTFVSFCSGVPGGIFFPLLAIGSVIGAIFGTVCIKYLGVPNIFLLNFSILAMAGHFASIVKAPITGIILIFEMTGSFEQLLPLSVVVFTAMFVSDYLHVNPVYDELLEDILEQKHADYKGKKSQKTLIELVVHLGSEIEGKTIAQVHWPKNSLIVAIKHGSQEIIPKGDTILTSGDFVTIMVEQVDSKQHLETLNAIFS